MTTFAESLKREIARVARKELRDEVAALRKTASLQRSEISALMKQVHALQSDVRKLAKIHGASPAREKASADGAAAFVPKGRPGRKVLFTAERLKTQRARLGFTQEQMAKLLGVSSLSVWKWESGAAAPRVSRVPELLQRLALGKREARAIVGASPK